MVASINYLYSQITKESSHIISLYNRVKSGAEGVKSHECITFKHLLNGLHFIVYTLNLMRHQAFIRLGDKILPYALKNAKD